MTSPPRAITAATVGPYQVVATSGAMALSDNGHCMPSGGTARSRPARRRATRPTVPLCTIPEVPPARAAACRAPAMTAAVRPRDCDTSTSSPLASLAEARETVRREWLDAQRKKTNEEFFAKLLGRYVVTIHDWKADGAGATHAAWARQ